MPHHIWPPLDGDSHLVADCLLWSADWSSVPREQQCWPHRAGAAVSTMTCQLLRRLSSKVSVTHHHPNSSSFRNDEMSWLTTPFPCDWVVIVRWVLHQLGLKTKQQKPVFWKIEAVGGVLSDENWNWSGLITLSAESSQKLGSRPKWRKLRLGSFLRSGQLRGAVQPRNWVKWTEKCVEWSSDPENISNIDKRDDPC